MGAYVGKGTSKVIFLTSAPATAGSPTAAELAAGTDLSTQLNEIAGLTATASFVDAPVLATLATAKVSGENQLADTTLTFLDDTSATTIRTAIGTAGTTGYLAVCPLGTGVGKRCTTWPVQSSGANDIITVANEPSKFTVGFGVTSAPTTGTIHA